MTIRRVSYLQGTLAVPYKLPAEDHRLNRAMLWWPDGGGGGLRVRSGVVWGNATGMGAVTVVAGGLSVDPFQSVIQGTITGTQGMYEVTSDAAEFRAVTAASPTEFRRGYLIARVYDRLNPGAGPVTDDQTVEVVYGPNAATAGVATLPTPPANSLILQEFAVSNTGVITLVGGRQYTVPRGMILPVGTAAQRTALVAQVGDRVRDIDTGLSWEWSGSVWLPARAPRVVATEAAAAAIPAGQLAVGTRVTATDTGADGEWDGTRWIWYDTRWQTWTPGIYIANAATAWTPGNSTVIARMFRKGREVTVEAELVVGSTANFNAGAGIIAVSYPPGYAPTLWQSIATASPPIGGVWISNGASAFGFTSYSSQASIPNRRFQFYSAAGIAMTSAVGTAGSWNIWAAGQALRFQATYDTSFEG